VGVDPERNSRYGLYFRLGGLFIRPTQHSGEVQLVNVSPLARLSGLKDGPIAGSYTRLGSNLMVAGTAGYAPPILNRQLSIETVLALPFVQNLYAGGTLADTSLAPVVLNVLPTGVPPLGTRLGEVKLLPPVVTVVYRLLPGSFRPYFGAGGCLLLVLDAKITNPVLTSASQPKLDIPPKLGWVVQAGVEARLTGSLFITADFKYIGGLNITATVKDIRVQLPAMPVMGAVKVGDNVVHISVNPVVLQLGVGMDL
jgi:outer membrane protein W